MDRHLCLVKLYNTSEESNSKDYSGIGVLISNAFVIVIAFIQNWDLGPMMFIYWAQSVIIGFFHFFRMILLKNFNTEGFTSGGKPVPANSKGKWSTALFFTVHYGFFHIGYLIFILSLPMETENAPEGGLWFRLSILGFFLGHGYSFFQNVRADLKNQPNLGLMMFLPYARIIPMHLTIFIGNAVGSNRIAVLAFSLLKTGADYLMHIVEHRMLQKKVEQEGQ
ncbi:MAG: DUF6498-containing protein [Verrucomicrobiales bacterium]|nr:DUF6498-containing protein [Verrucomicrobiales bacterium]